MLLREPMDPETEALLMFAARREHVTRVILPALQAGHWVVSDRFTDASYAYQGAGRGLGEDRIALLEMWVRLPVQPDLTLVFDVPVAVARQRLEGMGAQPDRFERQDAAFFDRVRDAYLRRAASHSGRVKVIDSARTVPEVRKSLEQVLATI
jgi:dTMP kinase